MSMNLHCSEVNLWQTPTYVTWMCWSDSRGQGKPDGGWRGVKYRYIEWVKQHANGMWSDEPHPQRKGTRADYENMRQSIEEHVAELNQYEKLHFYWL